MVKHMIEIHGKRNKKNTWNPLFCFANSCEGSGSLPKIVNSWPFLGMPIWNISEPNGLFSQLKTNKCLKPPPPFCFLGRCLCKWPFQKSCVRAPGDPPQKKTPDSVAKLDPLTTPWKLTLRYHHLPKVSKKKIVIRISHQLQFAKKGRQPLFG